ncbi:protein kinase domain-containing protein [Paraburkholderia sp.]|uniref:protein kinase domain-containing protein n=1 Tax=Paraburkholderia sp. TaxID=1926495 RepID=UPI003C7CF891
MDAAQAEILVNSLLDKDVCNWHIDGYLGKGKSAVVLAASRGSETAAIKIFHPELVERYGKAVQLERIMRERSLIGAYHPNLVRILDGGECPTTGHLFVVMERLPYSNLHDALENVPDEAVPVLISQVASAARFLEDRNLAHRDIKPENIAVTDDFSRAVLLDLGVLRPIGNSNLTDIDQRSFIGTLRYSSPEFLARQEEDTANGWRAITFYQLGAVLHDLLMKQVLFDSDSEPFSRLVEAVKVKVPEIHAENVKCVALANHCLVKNPATRLELVSWARFQNLNSDDDGSLSVARDRIKERQKYFQATVGESRSVTDSHRLTRKALDDVCNRLESRIAALMNDLQTFPLRTTQSVREVDKGVCSTYVHFEKDDLKGLAFRLAVLIRLTFLDANLGSPIFRAEASAVLADHEVSLDKMLPLVHIQSAELQTILDSDALETVFVDALDETYMHIEQGTVPNPGDVLPLTVKESVA